MASSSAPTFPLLVGERRVETARVDTVLDPFTGQPTARFHVAGAAELDAALDAAEAAFAVTRRQSAFERSSLLRRVAHRLADRAGELAERIIAEAGKPVTLAEAEVERARQTFLFAAEAARAGVRGDETLALDASPAGANHAGLVRRFPVGVILAITPFNFPLNLVAHKLAPALATGNTVLLKPSPRTPGPAFVLTEILLDAGMTPGQVNFVPAEPPGLLDPLLASGRVQMISFTGSVPVGWSLKARAGRARVTLELGGNAAVVIHADADWRAAMPLVAAGAFGYAGQSCISVQRILAHRSIYEAFKAALLAHVRDTIKAGDPRDRAVTVGPLIDPAARDRVLAWTDAALKAGAKLLTDLHPGRADRVLPPILLEDAPADTEVSCGEAFGPVATLAAYDDFDDALDRVNASRFGLQAGVFTRDVRLAWRAFDRLEVGGVLVNQVPTWRVENMPYGGLKDSGFGREGVAYAMAEMTEPRALIFKLD